MKSRLESASDLEINKASTQTAPSKALRGDSFLNRLQVVLHTLPWSEYNIPRFIILLWVYFQHQKHWSSCFAYYILNNKTLIKPWKKTSEVIYCKIGYLLDWRYTKLLNFYFSRYFIPNVLTAVDQILLVTVFKINRKKFKTSWANYKWNVSVNIGSRDIWNKRVPSWVTRINHGISLHFWTNNHNNVNNMSCQM